jgi:hypothetical protein
LKKAIGAPVAAVPRVFHERFGRAAIDQIAAALAPLTDGAPGK